MALLIKDKVGRLDTACVYVIIKVALKFKTWVPMPALHASQKHPRVDGWLFT